MLIQHIQTHPLLALPGTSLLAVSGGLDSVVLVDLFAKARHRFAIAHANFGLRGQASQADATLVQALAAHHQVPFHIQQLDATHYAHKYKVSIQMAARSLRYAWFTELAKKETYVRIVTAHHHNDQLETILRNLIKGTGIRGLRGMLAKRGAIVRPLLSISKAQLKAYALSQQLTWHEDKSNQSNKYDRNKIRHRVIPLFQRLNPNWEVTMHTNLTRFGDAAAIFEAHSEAWRKKVCLPHGSDIAIHYALLRYKSWALTVLVSWLEPFGFSWTQVSRWWASTPPTGKRIYSKTHFLLADRDRWIVGKQRRESPIRESSITTLPATIQLPHYQIKMGAPYTKAASPIAYAAQVALFDYQKLTFPLRIRPWQAGDTFCPLGMQKKHKKVSDFLIDAKIPMHKKRAIYVLESAGKIAWLVCHRIDERFKITPYTKQIVACTLIPKSKI